MFNLVLALGAVLKLPRLFKGSSEHYLVDALFRIIHQADSTGTFQVVKVACNRLYWFQQCKVIYNGL